MTIVPTYRRTLLQSASTAVALIVASVSVPALAYNAADDISDVQHSDGAGHDSSSSDSQSHDSDAHDSGSDHQQGGGQGQKGKGRDPGTTAGKGKGSMEDIFRKFPVKMMEMIPIVRIGPVPKAARTNMAASPALLAAPKVIYSAIFTLFCGMKMAYRS